MLRLVRFECCYEMICEARVIILYENIRADIRARTVTLALEPALPTWSRILSAPQEWPHLDTWRNIHPWNTLSCSKLGSPRGCKRCGDDRSYHKPQDDRSLLLD